MTRHLVFILVALGLAACGGQAACGGPTQGPAPSGAGAFAGTWNLETGSVVDCGGRTTPNTRTGGIVIQTLASAGKIDVSPVLPECVYDQVLDVAGRQATLDTSVAQTAPGCVEIPGRNGVPMQLDGMELDLSSDGSALTATGHFTDEIGCAYTTTDTLLKVGK